MKTHVHVCIHTQHTHCTHTHICRFNYACVFLTLWIEGGSVLCTPHPHPTPPHPTPLHPTPPHPTPLHPTPPHPTPLHPTPPHPTPPRRCTWHVCVCICVYVFMCTCVCVHTCTCYGAHLYLQPSSKTPLLIQL